MAESLEIERFFADNISVNGKQAVEILIDDADEKVNAFIELIEKKKSENADVESMETENTMETSRKQSPTTATLQLRSWLK